MATVKHNFCHETNKEQHREEFQVASLKSPTNANVSISMVQQRSWVWDFDSTPKPEPFTFGNENGQEGWKYGMELQFIDLAIENAPVRESLQNNISAFDVVSAEFLLKEGMEVGILAHSCTDLLAKTMQESLGSCVKGGEDGNEEKTEQAYEPQVGDTFITVGEIAFVGDEHVEYRVNSVPGFSGAPVFLLGGDEDNDMKIIAVHAGHSEERGTNFGFLVADKGMKMQRDAGSSV
ncbi:expressed unknown protein [Seminavis robusta]|uniref:Uncharacterized protein n=1 Tax=Seminavis robusta TaxID=568900 RepID=A0A9N8HRI6_9STRA|nr:expressed unknown protein [Seminavis robusta]|eukprot:Sro1325_g262970.1 n/a (235) ;mRNA; r:25507-26211